MHTCSVQSPVCWNTKSGPHGPVDSRLMKAPSWGANLHGYQGHIDIGWLASWKWVQSDARLMKALSRAANLHGGRGRWTVFGWSVWGPPLRLQVYVGAGGARAWQPLPLTH